MYVRMLKAFFDESTASDETFARYYVIAGYVGRLDHWAEFHPSWTGALSTTQVPSFHATDLDGGYKSFQNLRGSQHDDQRKRVQMRFANATKQHGILGVSVAISVTQHRRFKASLPAVKGQAHMSVPHMLAFRAFLQFVAQIAGHVAPGEVVDFVASEGPYSGRMRDLFNQLKRHVSLEWMRPVGTFATALARKVPALQAADQLAYETWRARENPAIRRPQLKLLRSGGQVRDHLLNKSFYVLLDENTKQVIAQLTDTGG
jgi:hypothetical protein